MKKVYIKTNIKIFIKDVFIGRLKNVTFNFYLCYDLHNSKNVSIA